MRARRQRCPGPDLPARPDDAARRVEAARTCPDSEQPSRTSGDAGPASSRRAGSECFRNFRFAGRWPAIDGGAGGGPGHKAAGSRTHGYLHRVPSRGHPDEGSRSGRAAGEEPRTGRPRPSRPAAAGPRWRPAGGVGSHRPSAAHLSPIGRQRQAPHCRICDICGREGWSRLPGDNFEGPVVVLHEGWGSER